MIDMAQADSSLRSTPKGVEDDGVFTRHRERVRALNAITVKSMPPGRDVKTPFVGTGSGLFFGFKRRKNDE